MIKVSRFFVAVILISFLNACSDSNEPSPSVDVEDFTTTIDENPQTGQVLGSVNATATSGTISFSLTAVNPEGALNIDAASGELSVADASLFNFEQKPVITAQAKATADNLEGTGSVVINLNNVDESDLFNIWDGPEITFTKPDGADPTAEENQDRITDNVWITRATNGGQIYNAKSETSANKTQSPAGTLWAVGSVDQIEALEFKQFREAVGEPKEVVGKSLVLYLVEDDVYLSVGFSSWSEGNEDKGGFAYSRSTDPN